MYSFPIVAVTKYHKYQGLKQHKLTALPFWRSEVQDDPYRAKIKVHTGLSAFLKVPGEICSFPCFPAAKGHLLSLACSRLQAIWLLLLLSHLSDPQLPPCKVESSYTHPYNPE